MIEVTTTSAPVARIAADAHPADTSVFPASPATHTTLSFVLRRLLHVHAQGVGVVRESDVLVILGRAASRSDVETHLPEMMWIAQGQSNGDEREDEARQLADPPKDARGAWIQRARFKATLRLTVPPTFATELVQCEVRSPLPSNLLSHRGRPLKRTRKQYFLHLRVPFPGIGNDVDVRLPVLVSSGIDAPVREARLGEVDDARAAHHPGIGAPPQAPHSPLLDLPP